MTEQDKETAMTDKPELLPCPFCGDDACCSPSTETDEPEREDREPLSWAVGCSCTAFVGPWSTEADAIAAWNTRATPSQPDASALVEALRLIGSGCTTRPDDVDNPTVLWMQGEARAAIAAIGGDMGKGGEG